MAEGSRRTTVVAGRALAVAMVLWGGVGQAAERSEQGPMAPDRNWQLGVTPSYSSGSYGTNTTSSFLYTPFSLRRYFKDGDATLIIPFVVASTDGSTTLVGGNPVRIDTRGTGNGNSTCDTRGHGHRSCLTGQPLDQTTTNSGLGDMLLKGRYYLVEETNYVPLIAVTMRLKLPTANAKLGLGTGAFDHGYGVELTKRFLDKWVAFLDGGYNFIGNPTGLQLRNQYWFDVGSGYYVTKDFLASMYYEEYRSLVQGVVNTRDLFVALQYKASAAWRFNGGVTVGLSNNAPDYMLSAGASYRF